MVELTETQQAHRPSVRPKMVWPFLLAPVAGALLIQGVPLLNTFAVVFGSLFWVGLALNALLIAFAFDAVRGAIPRFVVILPTAIHAANLWFSAGSIAEYRTEKRG